VVEGQEAVKKPKPMSSLSSGGVKIGMKKDKAANKGAAPPKFGEKRKGGKK
jgi:hypothetical protein